MTDKTGLARITHLGIGSAVAILLIVGASFYRSITVSRDGDRRVAHTHEALENLEGLLSAMQDVDASCLTFVLMGDEQDLASYHSGVLRASEKAKTLRKLTADNPSQEQRLDTLATLTEQHLQSSDALIALRQTRGAEIAVAQIRGVQGMEIRTLVRNMEDEEHQLLSKRDAQAERRSLQTRVVFLAGGLLASLVAFGAGWIIQQGLISRAKASESLQDSEDRYRMLLDGIHDYAIFMLDPQGLIVTWNAGAERVKGYRAEEIIGHNFSRFFPPEDIERGRPQELLRLTAASGRYEEQGIRVRKGGSRFLANVTFTALRDKAGNLQGFSEFSHDLSESKESGARYRGLLEAAPDAMVVVDQGGEIVLLNVQAEKQFGYRRDELLGQQVKNIIPEGFAERLIADGTRSATEALAQQIGTGIELNGRRKDGSQFPIEIMLSPLESAQGILVTAAIRDISVRKAAESHLAQMEGRYRGLLEAAPDAMVVVDQGGEIVLLNVQAEKQFGYRRDELLGQQVKNIIPEGFAERLIADGTRSATEALAQQIGTGIELNGRRKDGSQFPIEIMLSPLESAQGILVTAAIRDISVRKAAESHLAQMEGRYRGLLEAAPDAMVVVDQGGEIVLLNVQAEKQFGYRRDELLGQQVKSIVPEGFAERLIADALRPAADALAQQIDTGIELSGRRKNGSEFPIEIMLSPLENAEGILVTAAIRDITKRKIAETQLLQKVDELNRSNEELGQFAYVASHDLQEPLRMVASYTQLLSNRYKGRLDSDADEFIAFAVDGATRMQQLIQDLLTYSRAGSKKQQLLDVSSEQALQRAVSNLRGAIEESGALVTHDPLPTVVADEMQLIQLFQNLIGNGIKYQSPGVPRVHISAARNGGRKWIFSVKDNGMGIDSQYFERIFGMFQRLHKREEFAGTGIGLAICKKIVERHDGTLSVASQPGQGSTFSFALAGSERRS